MRSTLVFALLSTFLLSACGALEGEGGADMQPGEDCLSCHGGGGGRGGWSVAGTVFPTGTSTADAGLSGVSVVVTDSRGQTVTVVSNSAGNFYSGAALVAPLQVKVVRNGKEVAMPSAATSGACNSCHAPSGAASLRVFAP